MNLYSFDTEERRLVIGLAEDDGRGLAGRLASLAMVASDCGINVIECLDSGRNDRSERSAADEFIRVNDLFIDAGEISADDLSGESGYYLISRESDILCLGDLESPSLYSLFVSPDPGSVGKASVFAYLISSIMGFSSFVSFEVRFSVYELLNRIVERVDKSSPEKWINLVIEEKEGDLSVFIADRGVEFDPTDTDESYLGRLFGAGIFRGLGLSTTKKITDTLTWEHKSGLNRTLLYKAESGKDNAVEDGGKKMERFKISAGDPSGDGTRKLLLDGSLDSVASLMLENTMFEYLGKGELSVELDFEKVPFVSSAGVGVLLGIVSTFREGGGKVSFDRVSAKILSVFRLLNLDTYFVFSGTTETEKAY
ncbi:MAG: ATP-binding protein [Candidatus Krumholzibacteria bacterium]|nr:ATP-binding protein [Candidatus Krumholzibacteria bacterium]